MANCPHVTEGLLFCSIIRIRSRTHNNLHMQIIISFISPVCNLYAIVCCSASSPALHAVHAYLLVWWCSVVLLLIPTNLHAQRIVSFNCFLLFYRRLRFFPCMLPHYFCLFCLSFLTNRLCGWSSPPDYCILTYPVLVINCICFELKSLVWIVRTCSAWFL